MPEQAVFPSLGGLVSGESSGPFRRSTRGQSELVFHRGDPVDRVFYIESGQLLLLVTTAGGEEQVCSLRGAGCLIGLEAFLGLPAQFDVRVVNRAVLHGAEVDAFKAWMHKSPERVDAVTFSLAREAARLATERQFVAGPASHRLARFLRERETNPLIAHWRNAPLHALAGFLAMRPETLSRAIRSLHAEGLIDDGRELKVRDLAGLAAKIGDPT